MPSYQQRRRVASLASAMSLAEWSLFIGALLVTMVLAGTLLGRLPLSSAMVYLALGWLLGPDATNVLRPDPFLNTRTLELLASRVMPLW